MGEEKDIIGQLKKGHQHALTQLMSSYQDYVFSILTSMLYRHEAEEACQDTFVKVYKNINQYNGQSKFSTWLYSIAYRTGLDYIKKRRRHQSIDDISFQLGAETEDNRLNHQDMRRWINRAIGKLDPADAALIRLYYLNEYNVQEVAEITGLSVSNVKVKLYRTRNTLKKQMSHLKLSDIIS